ncbi:MAG: threonine aldolase, partial [bacterium]|nr:threonine aldolase [bacterium]
DAAQLVSELGERGVLAIPVSRDEVRLVTHRDVSRGQIERAMAIFRDLAASA